MNLWEACELPVRDTVGLQALRSVLLASQARVLAGVTTSVAGSFALFSRWVHVSSPWLESGGSSTYKFDKSSMLGDRKEQVANLHWWAVG